MSFRDKVHMLRVDTHAVWLAARDVRTPWYAKLLGGMIAAYALSPIDLIPDFVPVLGLIDDVVLIPAGVWLMLRLIPGHVMTEHRSTAERASERPVSRAAAAVIITFWLAVGASVVWSLRAYQYW